MTETRNPNSAAIKAAGPHVERTTLSAGGFTLAFMFQITTACAVFFAVMLLSPPLAILIAAVVTPAIVRTGFSAALHRRENLPFAWPARLECFVASLGVVFLVAAAGCLGFVLISVMFGLFMMMISSATGMPELMIEAGIIGTAGGMVWGFAGAVIAIVMALVQLWMPRLKKPVPIQ